MKKYIFLFAIFLIVSCPATKAQVFQNDDLTISKLEEKVWVVETTDKTTMYIIEGKDKAMLIDTGTNCKKLDEVVKRITQKPLYVVITHAHVDHAGNMNFFEDVYLHLDDTVLLSRIEPYSGTIHYINDGDFFDLGGKQIEVKHMPGHTPGSIVLLDKKSGNCFSGDAFGSGMVWLQLWPFSTMRTYISSCEKMEQLMNEGISKIYCGHYPYVKKAFGKEYMGAMKQLAENLDRGIAPESKPFLIKIPDIGCENPMIVTDGTVSIVYDPDHLK